jgi:ribosome-interacting GTPase 1
MVGVPLFTRWVWGPSSRFDGQRVGREHEVLDGDVVEILR